MIEIKNAILHILDANSNVKVIADYEMDIDDDVINKYLMRQLKKVGSSGSTINSENLPMAANSVSNLMTIFMKDPVLLIFPS